MINVITKKEYDKNSSKNIIVTPEEKRTFEVNSNSGGSKRTELREKSVKNDRNMIKKNMKNLETNNNENKREDIPRKCSEQKDIRKDNKDIGDYMAKKK